MALMTTLIAIIATVIFGLVGFIFGRFEKRFDSHAARIKEVDKSQKEIVSNYLSRFEELKERDEQIKDLLHRSNAENHQSHTDIMEFVHFVRAKLNELTPRNN